MSNLPPAWNLHTPTCLIYDILYLELCHPTPSITWYTTLLAARNVIFTHLITSTKTHTQHAAYILTILCNNLGTLDLRFLCLLNKKRFAKLARPLPIEIAEVISRPAKPLHLSRLHDVVNFIGVQILSVTGSLARLPCTDTSGRRCLAAQHMVYLMVAQDNDYIGRTNNDRTTASKIKGILPRWSEHVRQLHRHIIGNIPKDRARRRYAQLRSGVLCACLNFVIYSTCSADTISRREAVSICTVQPRSNDTDLKHFAESMCPSRHRTGQHRKRPNGSVRNKTRKTLLRQNAEQWGEDVSSHGRGLTAAYNRNLAADFLKYTNKKAR